MFDNEDDIMSRMAPSKDGIFAVHGDLDGQNKDEFQDRDQFIGIKIGKEEFLLPIAHVREIIMIAPITYVPFSPEFIDGVFNLRGSIVPIVNTRKLLGVERGGITAASRIIVTRYDNINFGLIVDGITYVRNLLPTEVEQRTLPGKGTGAEFITSICKQDNYICGILDLARILTVAAAGANLSSDDAVESEPAA
jgi:purine-binding chemotaxis protein CheW